MKKLKSILFIAAILSTISCVVVNTAKGGKASEDWHYLFNGKNLEGWVVKVHHHELGDNYANTFRVSDGKIQINYDDYDVFDERFAHLFYNESFSSYHLKFEY